MCGLGFGLIYSRNMERQIVANTSKLALKSFQDYSGVNWSRASFNSAGFHTLGHNSDFYSEPQSGSRLLGVVCDGATNGKEGKFSLSGRGLAHYLVEAFAEQIKQDGSFLNSDPESRENCLRKVVRNLELAFRDGLMSSLNVGDEVF